MGIIFAFKVKIAHLGHFWGKAHVMVVVKHNLTYNSIGMMFRELQHHIYQLGSEKANIDELHVSI